MTCPKCGGKLSVVDSRERDVESVWRKRQCKACGYGFETLEYEVNLINHILKIKECAR